MPTSAHSFTVQRLLEQDIGATRFLIPDEEIARFYVEDFFRPTNDISIACDGLIRQLERFVAERPFCKADTDDGV